MTTHPPDYGYIKRPLSPTPSSSSSSSSSDTHTPSNASSNGPAEHFIGNRCVVCVEQSLREQCAEWSTSTKEIITILQAADQEVVAAYARYQWRERHRDELVKIVEGCMNGKGDITVEVTGRGKGKVDSYEKRGLVLEKEKKKGELEGAAVEKGEISEPGRKDESGVQYGEEKNAEGTVVLHVMDEKAKDRKVSTKDAGNVGSILFGLLALSSLAWAIVRLTKSGLAFVGWR